MLIFRILLRNTAKDVSLCALRRKKKFLRNMLATTKITHSKCFLNKYDFKEDLNFSVVDEFFKYDGIVFQSEGAA